MTTKKNAVKLSPRLRRKAPKTTTFGRHLVTGLKEVLSHRRGEIELEGYEVHVPSVVDVAAIRKRMGLSQRRFASRFGFDVTAVHAWEQGRRQPDRAARLYLRIIEREPQAVARALQP